MKTLHYTIYITPKWFVKVEIMSPNLDWYYKLLELYLSLGGAILMGDSE